MPEKAPIEIFYKLILGTIIIIGFGIYLSVISHKPKSGFNKITGTITHLDSTFGRINKRDHRYIYITDSNEVFDLFIGKRTMDFSPEFEQIDKLKPSDEITVYYADKTPLQNTQYYNVIKTVQFIDKDGEPYFIRGNKNKYGSYFFVSSGLFAIVMLLLAKRLGKFE
ncbi:MAG: hypothetical protein HRU50_10980 [Winogradskyella sp.]|uniref:hypothetical protein n=1 Tax=Winogradskyella sp. TaxID=1883156 RepID=UPI0025FA55B9|nr:hypothetical protein [Winogradskyella sp.]NRB60446.1 hypothetical protein [Winogradskyella sp.]